MDIDFLTYSLPIIARGALATILFCLAATIFSLIAGTALALLRLLRLGPVRFLATSYVELFRNTPFLVQAFLIYFGLAQIGFRLSATTAGIVILSLYGAALFAEAIRGAILSVPKGQLEAARAVGMPYLLAMRRIVLPQAVGYLVPVLTNLTIGLVKDSAALAIITVPELSMAAQRIVGQTFQPVETFLLVALIYWLITTGIAYIGRRVTGASQVTFPPLAGLQRART